MPLIVSGSILPFIITADNIESFITSTISSEIGRAHV